MSMHLGDKGIEPVAAFLAAVYLFLYLTNEDKHAP